MAKKTELTKCALCYEELKLMKSHIVPKFVFNYLKKTSLTGKFRDPTNFNKRLQDGPKYKLLCENCEQLFSESERYFSENIFSPYIHDVKMKLKYDYNLKYFIESIHWRFLLTQMQSYKGEELQKLKDIEIGLRARLRFRKQREKVLVLLQLDYPRFPKRVSHSIFALDEDIIKLASSEKFSFKRMVTCDLFFYKNQVYIYSYYCGLILSSVYNCRTTDFLSISRLLVRSNGKLKLREIGFNNIISAHLLTLKCRMIYSSLDKVSNQERKIFLEQIERSAKLEVLRIPYLKRPKASDNKVS
jgi:hypothetical protein